MKSPMSIFLNSAYASSPERVLLEIELNPARTVLDMAKTGLSEAPHGNDPARNGHFDPLLLKLLLARVPIFFDQVLG